MLRFNWNGQVVTARKGDSIAAALSASGVTQLGTRRSGAPRGLFCGMGVCHDCIVTIDNVCSRRACMVEVAEGMVVQAQPALGERTTATTAPAPGDPRDYDVDLVIVGAGPAGLNAAIMASDGQLKVMVLDERGEIGGQYFKPRSKGYRGTQIPDDQHRRGNELRRQAAESGAKILTGQTVWFARREGGAFEFRADALDGSVRVTARAVILATGAVERPAMVPGWTRPGVLTIGAAQTLVRRYGVVPPGPILVAGNGPLGLQLAVELVRAGGEVVGLAERGDMRSPSGLARMLINDPGLVRDGIGYRAEARRHRIPVLTGWEVVDIFGSSAVKGAVLRRLDGSAVRKIDATTICLGDGFMPQIELARMLGVPVLADGATWVVAPTRDSDGTTPVPGVWIAGDAGGLGGAALAAQQGRLAAAGALAHLGRSVPDCSAARAAARKAAAFQAGLWQFYAAPPRPLPQGETTVCRCEEVSADRVRAAIAEGARDLGAVKRATRLGMGMCQGRACSSAALRMLAEAGAPQPPQALFAPQIPARPVTLASLSREKPEWGGHRESAPGARPGIPPTDPIARPRAELVVIGAGITGVCAALEAARRGVDVLCIDRGRINGEASGGNAGSLHLQLLSWDFGNKAVAGGSPQLLTLPLQKESIGLWRDLENETGGDFEMRVTGGLMVAEDADQIAFLENKCAAEARMGIHSEVIDAARIRQIVPHISDSVVAAAWCAGEGKINPLAATATLARAARDAGARIEEQTDVTAITCAGDGYVIATPRGDISAHRILIAAGGWSARIAGLLGVDIPIRGAPLQMIVTEAAPPLIPCLIAHADRHLTMKQADTGGILIGGAWPAVTGPGGQPLVLPESLEGNAWVATHTIPALAGLSMLRSWAAMNIDIDGAPLIGPLPGHPRVTVAATANGYTLGPIMGREAATIATGGRTRQDLLAFSIDRFQ